MHLIWIGIFAPLDTCIVSFICIVFTYPFYLFPFNPKWIVWGSYKTFTLRENCPNFLFSGLYFPIFGRNMESYFVFRVNRSIQFEYGKIRTEIKEKLRRIRTLFAQ